MRNASKQAIILVLTEEELRHMYFLYYYLMCMMHIYHRLRNPCLRGGWDGGGVGGVRRPVKLHGKRPVERSGASSHYAKLSVTGEPEQQQQRQRQRLLTKHTAAKTEREKSGRQRGVVRERER